MDTDGPNGALVARILADRGLLRRGGGLAAALWAAPLPIILALWCAYTNMYGPLEFIFVLAASCALTVQGLRRRLCSAQAALQTGDLDRTWLWPLIDALRWRDGRVRAIARNRLIAVLPTITLEDVSHLSDDQLAVLFAELTPYKAWTNPEFAQSVLAFAARVRADQALRVARRLAALPRWYPRTRSLRLNARAVTHKLQECAAIANSAMELHPRTKEATPASDNTPRGEAPQWLRETEADLTRQPAMRFPFLLAAWGVFVPFFGWQAWRLATEHQLLPGLLAAAAAVGSTQLYRIAVTPLRTRVAQRLAKLDDVEAIGGLVDVLEWPEAQVQEAVIPAITRLLPRLRATDTSLLNPRQRGALCRWLSAERAVRNSEFLLAILRAFEQVGDTDAIPAVRALADMRPMTTPERRVCTAASECLPALLERGQLNRHSQVLLRACTDDHPERLLRSASGSAEDPAKLLRLAHAELPDA